MTSTHIAPTRRGLLRGAGIGAAALAAGVAVPALTAPKASAYPVAPVEGFVHEISRAEVIERAMFWVNNPRAYSMENYDIGPEQDQNILWRTDCSGFVSMALKARFTDNPTGMTTETLHPDLGYEVSHPIDAKDLMPGDFILQRNHDSSSGVGHVVLFNGWLDDQGHYECLEQSYGAGGTVKRSVQYGYDGLPEYHPFRYNLIRD